MNNLFSDTEQFVKQKSGPSLANCMHIQSEEAGTIGVVANRNDALSSYVRFRLLDLKRQGKHYRDLAKSVGMPTSFPSQVLSGTGVGGINAPRFARMFGVSYSELIRLAEEWHEKEGRPAPPTHQRTTQEEAAATAKDYGVCKAALEEVDRTYAVGHEHEGAGWWLEQYLVQQRKVDAKLIKERDEQEAERKYQRKVRAVVREAKRERDAAKKAPRKARKTA